MDKMIGLEGISPTLQTIINQASGSRNNEWGESRIWTLRDIVYHEMTALMNSDIPEFLNEKYGADICKADDGSFDQDAFECEAPRYVEDVIRFIEKKMGASNLYGVWLTTKEGVCEIYHSGSQTAITTYRIPDDALVISDLDIDGSLFVTGVHPEELETSFEVVSATVLKRKYGAA